MSQTISLFSGYNQKENRTTNYCLLILKMLYEENPKFFAEVLGILTDETVGNYVGVTFLQQQKRQSSVPDGLICQRPFTVYIETKNYDWFYDDQLQAHLNALNAEVSGAKILLVLSNFQNVELRRFDRIRQIAHEKYTEEIYFNAVSFEDFLQAVRTPVVSKNLADTIADFGNYLNEQNLLSSWQHTLDVINCATIPEDILVHHAYMCPAMGGHYNHNRCRYFGMYRNKRVGNVALIQAVIDLEDEQHHSLKWSNVSLPENVLLDKARQGHRGNRSGMFPTRVFVLDELFETNFIKDTPGGMQGSKQYFDVSSLKAHDAEDLAQKLNGLTWTSLSTRTL